MTQNLDEADWAEVLGGRGEAFGRMFDRYFGMVSRQARRFSTGNDVDDIIAVAFLELWRRRKAVHLVDGSIAPWLLVTTANVARQHRRSRVRYERLLARLPPPDWVESPEEGIGDQDVVLALRQLPLNDQRVLTLCVLEGYSERETALVLGVAAGTVKSRLHRAKKRLAHLLKDNPTLINEGELGHGV